MKKLNLMLLCLTMGTCEIGQTKTESKHAVNSTNIEFIDDIFVFGEIVQGEIIQNVFTFTNTGSEPLVITNAKGSCGCTVPRWPKEPIMPGETADLLVQFDSKGKKGTQSKRVSITANTSPQTTYLVIKGKVLPSDKSNETVVNRSSSFDIDAGAIKVFPNPTRDFAKLDIGEYKGEAVSVHIIDASGKSVISNKFNADEDNMSIDLRALAPGTYVASLKIGNHNRIAKQLIKMQ